MPGEPGRVPHRPQPGSGHRPRRPEKPAGSVCRSSPLPSCVLQMAPLSPAQAATTTRSRPQLRPQDRTGSQTPGTPPVRRSRHPLRPHSARSGSAGHRWPAARHASWLTLITSSARHIMRRSARQAPSAASTRPPRRTAVRVRHATREVTAQRDMRAALLCCAGRCHGQGCPAIGGSAIPSGVCLPESGRPPRTL
jgi:hypothetical protein